MTLRKQVIEHIEIVRSCQLSSGAIDPQRLGDATTALQTALDLLRPVSNQFPSLATCIADMDDWLAAGLQTLPDMRHLIQHGLTLADEGIEDIVLTVTTTLNYSESYSLELIHFRRFEGAPAAALRNIYHCRHLMIAHLLDATSGFGMESNCIVMFTECLAGGSSSPDVMDVFFTSKNALRGKKILQPIMENILTADSFTELRHASLDDLRLIVPCKTVTHEWSHRQGVMPLTEYRVLFDNMIGAGLEEARVELNGAHILFTLAEQNGPFAMIYHQAAQFIIADRLFRYPYSALPDNNADAVSGQYFLGQFIAKGLLTCNAGGVSLAGRSSMLLGLQEILGEIKSVQYRALISSIPEAHRVVREHVATYSPALDASNTMHRSVFYHWMEQRLHSSIPAAMDWKAAFEEYGE